MDHHSAWLGVCIGFKNKKFYVLTLFYATTALMNIIAFCAPIVYEGHTSEHFGSTLRCIKFCAILLVFGLLVRELLANVRRMAENVMKIE